MSLAASNYSGKQKRSKPFKTNTNTNKPKVSEVIELVKMSVDIEQAADKYLGISLSTVKGTHRTKMISCPFHSEKTASFSISKQKNAFKCFGCGVQGDVINLVSNLENVSLARAAFIIAEDFGLIDNTKKPEIAEKIKQSAEDKAIEKRFRADEKKQIETLLSLRDLFIEAVSGIEETNDLVRFGGSYHFITKIDYFLDLLMDTNKTDYKERVSNYFYVQEWIEEKIKPILERKTRS
jgi:DNA primase